VNSSETKKPLPTLEELEASFSVILDTTTDVATRTKLCRVKMIGQQIGKLECKKCVEEFLKISDKEVNA